MLTTKDHKEIFEKVRTNVLALTQCEGPHDFVCQNPEDKLRKRYKCSKCGGECDCVNYLWYMRGLQHGIYSVTGKKKDEQS